jgi:hypothetical protein
LGEGVAEDGDVVLDGVEAGVPAAQLECQRLPGALGPVVDEGAERVEAETALERGGGLLLLRVRRD